MQRFNTKRGKAERVLKEWSDFKKEGFFPWLVLAPFLAPIAGEIVKDVYTFVKGKIRGSGIKTNHIKTHDEKKQFIINLLSKI